MMINITMEFDHIQEFDQHHFQDICQDILLCIETVGNILLNKLFNWNNSFKSLW